jgi:hypothetical protein
MWVKSSARVEVGEKLLLLDLAARWLRHLLISYEWVHHAIVGWWWVHWNELKALVARVTV